MEKKTHHSKKIRKGDRVIAIAGDNRGFKGIVQSCNGDRVIVQGFNICKKHIKKSQENKGRIVEMECPVHISNLKICAEDDTPVKLKVRTNEQGEREYFYYKGDQEMIYRSVKKPK